MTRVNNTPSYAEEYKYIVAREVNGELWFYGAWNSESKAREVAKEVDGVVIQR